MRGYPSKWLRWAAALAMAGCGRVSQSPACEAYVGCIQALDSLSGEATNLDRFAAAGGCWKSDATAESCTGGCTRGLVALRARTPSLPAECSP